MPRKPPRRRVCFVTGTRAEFGLMRTTLAALRDHPAIALQLIVTGVHTHASRGRTLNEIVADGWPIDVVIPWDDTSDATRTAIAMGQVTAALAAAFATLRSDVVLVVGDRVEAFAAASAAHVSGHIVAHVHGGDRAMGQADDALRHAISKLAHIHLPATRASADRLFAMGEDRWRIHVVGAPGIDGIGKQAASRAGISDIVGAGVGDGFALFLLHPTEADAIGERDRTRTLLRHLRARWDGPIVALLPNNDPGAAGIAAALRDAETAGTVRLITHARRDAFLALLREARCLVGNSSSGIIEAGAFGTPVLDVGPRQAGRERGPNVIDATWSERSLASGVRRALAARRTLPRQHPYAPMRGGTAATISDLLARVALVGRIRRKLVRY